MKSYERAYRRLVAAAVKNRVKEEERELRSQMQGELGKSEIDALMHPEQMPPVFALSDCCNCPPDKPCACEVGCLFSAISRDKDGKVTISAERCIGCGSCIEHCKEGRLVDRKDIIPLFEALNHRNVPVYALLAPAAAGQFGSQISIAQLRSALKRLGFYGMLEVAFFADILTLKEALEFDRIVQEEDDFLLTSCCCPLWVAMIRKVYASLVGHIPPSVSPMVACGRSVKRIHPDAVTVFIGPCVAKKAEAREADVADAVDYVLTFRELKDIFDIAEIDPQSEREDERDHSCTTGRIYARTAGVSTAVEQTLAQIRPEQATLHRAVPLRARQADGVPACKAMLEDVLKGKIDANFLEGMGCVGGCVGGPRANLPKEQGREFVNAYGEEAQYKTPVDNPFVLELLQKLGFDRFETLLEPNLFVRDFSMSKKEETK